MATLLHFPSLSEDGWVTATAEQADYVFAHFFASDYSQTQLYLGQVASMAKILQHKQGDIPATITALKEGLTEYLSRYFTMVTVDVAEDASSAITDSSKVALSIYANFKGSDGKEFNLAKLLEIANGKVARIVNLNNG